jgi:hypothetical protein
MTEDAPTPVHEDADDGLPPGLSLRGLHAGDRFTMTFEIPKAPLPPRFSGRPVYHYASHQGVLGIVSDHALWASSIRSLNDGSEAVWGRQVIRDHWERRKRDYPEPLQSVMSDLLERAESSLDESRVFVLCASERGDDLGQFRNYGDVALAIDANIPLDVRDDPIGFPDVLHRDSTGYGWRKVLYSKRSHEAAARALIHGFASELIRLGKTEALGAPNDISSITMCWWYASLVPLIKHSAFSQEREVRLVRGVTSAFTNPLHRVSYLGVVPYVEMERVTESGERAPLPLLGAHLGPIHYPEPAELGLRSLLRSAGYVDATVTRTATPFRG